MENRVIAARGWVIGWKHKTTARSLIERHAKLRTTSDVACWLASIMELSLKLVPPEMIFPRVKAPAAKDCQLPNSFTILTG